MRNGLSFSNWYAGRHWGNASEWGKVAKGIGYKPDKTPAIGSIGWYRRGHVSYVEDVYSNGTILISEMNTDGHNGFHFATVSPGMSSYPDKFIHLADVVPVDTTPPTEPNDVRAASHRGRTAISWRASSDTSGVAGYRVFRNGVLMDTVQGTTYRDPSPLAGTTASYEVVAVDSAGHASTPGRVTVQPGTESVDRAWVTTSAGPALCGRAGTERRQRLACRLLVGDGWREVAMSRKTRWGDASTRAFLPTPDGSVSYCRATVRKTSVLSCTALDPDARTWGRDITSSATPRLVSDATWLTTPSGPARCGLSGSPQRPTVTCSTLGFSGWRSATTTRRVPWGHEDGRAFVAAHNGSIAFCRWLTDGRGARSACAELDPFSMSWSSDRVSGRLSAGAPAYPTWVGAYAGPAACWSPSADRRGGCRVLTPTGWRTASLPRKAKSGTAGTRSFLTDQSGTLTWCRVVGRSASCTELSEGGGSWKAGRSVRIVPKLIAENRTWTQLAYGPALCGRAGSARQQRLSCQVLTADGWRTSASHVVAWGSPGYRAFVPSGSGVAYCRTVPARKQGAAVSCTPMSKLEWGVTRTSQRVRLVLPDPF
jgi:hypothetical protein